MVPDQVGEVIGVQEVPSLWRMPSLRLPDVVKRYRFVEHTDVPEVEGNGLWGPREIRVVLLGCHTGWSE